MCTYIMEKKKDNIFTPQAFKAERNAAKAATARTKAVVHIGRPVYSGLESVMVTGELLRKRHAPTHVFSKESLLLFQRAASAAPRHPLCRTNALDGVRGKLGSALWVGDPGSAPYSAPDSLLNTDQGATHLKTATSGG